MNRTNKLVLKSRKQIMEMILACNGDIYDVDNIFYLNKSGETITVNGYCDEEKVFTCVEFPEYVFPLEFISHEIKKTYNTQHETGFKEIAKIYECSSENIRKIYKKAIATLSKTINSRLCVEDLNDYRY